ncbi:MAG: response regulator transcription factor, partial [Deltaproteobacteria bacterium]|nr:response regulator transcription factor [Deltaproteobacteria bacterium]
DENLFYQSNSRRKLSMDAYTLILADDHAMFREGIRKIIERIEGALISGEVNDGLELLELLKRSSPNLVILDISMPNLRGLEAIREIKKTYPKVKVLVLTMHKKKEFLRQALRDGADGFLLKEDAGSELIRAVQTVRNGGKYLSPLLSSVLTSLAVEEENTEVLTMREREVLKLLAEGKRTKEIAAALYISPHTVRRHRSNIMEKLNIKNLADLVKYAISQSYILDHS